ncbi:MAG: hypothetical protein ACFFBE_11895 [Promethearchaeota archaeon]
MKDLEKEIDQLIGWYFIKRKYTSGLVLTLIGSFVLIIKVILLLEFFPNYIAYSQDIIVYNGPLVRLYIGFIMGIIGTFLLLIGLPFFIINIKKKKNL